MHPKPIHGFFFFLLFASFVAARTNFTQCLEDFRNDPNAVGGVDYRGHPTSPPQAVGFTYETCKSRCGSESESFSWKDFTQLFASWLLPWLALISQLPFGSGNYADDFMSVIMSVGSPALAAYSLVLTSLNARSVYRRAKKCNHESKLDVAKALITLQQIPLELTKDGRLLAFLPVNHHWRQEIADRLNRRNAWSVAAGTSVAWVVIAFLFTLVDSFVSLDDTTTEEPSEGQAVGTLWLWLLCLVIGWLWVPTFTSGELKRAIGHANRQAVKKAAKRLKQKANKAMSRVTTRISRRVPILRGSRKPGVEDVIEEDEKMKVESSQDGTRRAEGTNPGANLVLGTAPQQSTVSFRAQPEDEGGHGHIHVSANPTANQSAVTLPRSIAQSSIHPERHRLFTLKDLGSLNRDELRTSATFNYSRIMRYLILVDDVLSALDRLAHEREEARRPVSELTPAPLTKNPTFPPGAFITMFNALVAALILQCGISAAATGIVVSTPTIGLGCRSLGYIIYAGLSIVILVFTIISTIFARISETREGRSPLVQRFTKFIAVTLRRICLPLALINMTGLILISCLQFSNFLDNCYCNGSVLGRGTGSYIIISYNGWIDTMRTARIIAIALAGASMLVYMVFLWLMSVLPAELEDMAG